MWFFSVTLLDQDNYIATCKSHDWLGTDFAIAEAVNFVVESERQGSTTLRKWMTNNVS